MKISKSFPEPPSMRFIPENPTTGFRIIDKKIIDIMFDGSFVEGFRIVKKMIVTYED